MAALRERDGDVDERWWAFWFFDRGVGLEEARERAADVRAGQRRRDARLRGS